MGMSYNTGNTTAKVIGSINTNNIAIADGTTQIVEQAYIKWGTTATYFQVATANPAYDLYFLGARVTGNEYDGDVQIFDASSGNAPSITMNTMYSFGNPACMLYNEHPRPGGNQEDYKSPAPIKVTNGIRVKAGGASSGGSIIVTYMKVMK